MSQNSFIVTPKVDAIEALTFTGDFDEMYEFTDQQATFVPAADDQEVGLVSVLIKGPGGKDWYPVEQGQTVLKFNDGSLGLIGQDELEAGYDVGGSSAPKGRHSKRQPAAE
jgi:hypothetical protein